MLHNQHKLPGCASLIRASSTLVLLAFLGEGCTGSNVSCTISAAQGSFPGLDSGSVVWLPEDSAMMLSSFRVDVTFLAWPVFIHSGLVVARRILANVLSTALPGDGDGDDMAAMSSTARVRALEGLGKEALAQHMS